MRSYSSARAFTLVEIMIVVLIIGILMAIAVPNFIRAGATSRRDTCISNLRQIEAAKEQWAMDFRKTTGDVATQAELTVSANREEGYILQWPACPANGTYSINAIGSNATCSISGHILP